MTIARFSVNSYPAPFSSSHFPSPSFSSTLLLVPRLALLSSSVYSCHSPSLPSITTLKSSQRRTISANVGKQAFPFSKPFLSDTSSSSIRAAVITSASGNTSANPSRKGKGREAEENQQFEEEEVEEELPWIQEKALDLVEFTGSVTQAIPGPRVGRSSLPWILALPLAYVGVTFVVAFVKTVRKFSSPKAIRRKLVNKNLELCKSIDELFEKGRDGVSESAFKKLMQQTGFSMPEIMRKYIRYALNENSFNTDLIMNLIQLRKASSLDDSEVAEIVNDISKRIVKDKGPVVMDMSGYSEKGFKRKLAVQALFGKIYYLSELPEFCARGSSLIVKEIFGVTDEDAEKLRLHTQSELGDVDSLEKLVEDSDFRDSGDASSNTP